MKEGTSFERLTAEIFEHLRSNKDFESVEHDVLLNGIDGPRQIDVLLKGKIGPIEVVSIVECKDYNKKVTVTEVDALHSKMLDVKANKAILVARKGFSGTAIKKATRLGITLCTAHEAFSEKWPFQKKAPFIIEELSCETIQVSFEFIAIDNMQGIILDRFGSKTLAEITANHWNQTEIDVTDAITRHNFEPSDQQILTAYTADGRDFPIEKLSFTMHIEKKFYFGYLDEFNSSKCLEFISPPTRHVVFNPASIGNYRESLAKFESLEAIPQVQDVIKFKAKLLHNPRAVFANPKK